MSDKVIKDAIADGNYDVVFSVTITMKCPRCGCVADYEFVSGMCGNGASFGTAMKVLGDSYQDRIAGMNGCRRCSAIGTIDILAQKVLT